MRPGLLFLIVFFASSLLRAWQLSRRRDDPWLTAMGGFAFTGLVGFGCGAQFVSSEGIEVPFFVALVGLAALEVARQAPAPIASDRLRHATARMPVLAQQALQAQRSRRAR